MRAVSIEVNDNGFITFDPEIEKRERELLQKIRSTNEEIARRAVEILTVYPPETAGNFPPPPYWERGTGMINSAGETTQISYKYGQSKDRWQYETTLSDTAVTTRASTNIPYAPYVGSADLQAWFHADTGWTTDEEAVDVVQPEAQQALNEVLGEAFIDLFQKT